jgi:hypothetical protein
VKNQTTLAAILSSFLLAGLAASACQSEAHARRNDYYKQCMDAKGATPSETDTKACKEQTKEYARQQKEQKTATPTMPPAGAPAAAPAAPAAQ